MHKSANICICPAQNSCPKGLFPAIKVSRSAGCENYKAHKQKHKAHKTFYVPCSLCHMRNGNCAVPVTRRFGACPFRFLCRETFCVRSGEWKIIRTFRVN